MGCASSKKRTTSVDDLTGQGQGKNKEPSAQVASSNKNKNGQVGNAANDIKPIKKESSHQTSSAPPSDTSAIQIPGTHKSFLAPDGIPFIDEDVDDDAEVGGRGDVNSISADNAVQKPDVNKNVVKGPAVPDQKPQEVPQNPAPVKAAVVVDERRHNDIPPELPASEPPTEPSPVPAAASEEQAEEARKREIAMDILSKELDLFTSGEHNEIATSITVTESEPVAADNTTVISQPVRAVTPDDQEKAAVKIQAGIRGYRDRQRVKAIRAAKEEPGNVTATGSATNQPDAQNETEGSHDKPADDVDPSGVKISVECDEPNPSDVSQQDELDDPEKQRAAVKIQASFKGYKTRKELGKVKK